MARRVLIVDPVCPTPYQARTVYDRALGDAEASAVRIAEGMAQRGHRVTVAQCGRGWPSRSPGGVAYVPFRYGGGWSHLPRAESVVVLRQHKVLARVRRQFPDARLALWLRAVPGSRRRGLATALRDANATAVCVSDAHRRALHDVLRRVAGDGPASAASVRVHDPVDDDLRPDGTRVDPDKLVALPSSGGALGEVLAAFGHVRAHRPTARLVVAGRADDHPALPDGVACLGALPHHAVLRHVREAFAVFAPQASHEPVSGHGAAEANAVGTPVLAHPFGATGEALSETAGDHRQLVDARDPAAAARRLARWWDEGRPDVHGARHLRTAHVVRDWERLLGLDLPAQPAARRVPASLLETAALPLGGPAATA